MLIEEQNGNDANRLLAAVFIMVEVSREKFREIISQIPYKTSFILGQSGVRYEGKGRKFKNALFAKHDNGKYYVISSLVS